MDEYTDRTVLDYIIQILEDGGTISVTPGDGPVKLDHTADDIAISGITVSYRANHVATMEKLNQGETNNGT